MALTLEGSSECAAHKGSKTKRKSVQMTVVDVNRFNSHVRNVVWPTILLVLSFLSIYPATPAANQFSYIRQQDLCFRVLPNIRLNQREYKKRESLTGSKPVDKYYFTGTKKAFDVTLNIIIEGLYHVNYTMIYMMSRI